MWAARRPDREASPRFLFVFLTLLLVGACDRRVPTLSMLAPNTAVIRLPNPWFVPGSGAVMTLPSRFEFRNLKADELLVARESLGARSINLYRLGWGAELVVGVASEETWLQASPAGSNTVQIRGRGAGDSALVFQGRTYSRSGEVWGSAVASSDGRWLALLGYTGSPAAKAKPNPLPWLGGGEPAEGRIFVEIYNTATGRKIAAVDREYSGFGPSLILEQAEWVADRYFILPVDFLAQTLLVVRVLGSLSRNKTP